jgi:hypothetical protein
MRPVFGSRLSVDRSRAAAQEVVDNAQRLIQELEARIATEVPEAKDTESREQLQEIYAIYRTQLSVGVQILREQEAAGRAILENCFIFTPVEELKAMTHVFLHQMISILTRWRESTTEASQQQETILCFCRDKTFTPLIF